MQNNGQPTGSFAQGAAINALTLVVAAALAWAAPALHTSRYGRFPASMIAVARSRAILDNAGVTGYYERLFAEMPAYGNNRIPDSFRVLRLRPHTDGTNAFGFFGPEYPLQKPPRTRRIALLGDSLTQPAFDVEAKQTYSALLEDRLNATHPSGESQRFEVMNFAVGGYQITQILDVALMDAHRFAPDVYVLALTELSISRNWDVHLAELVQKGLDPKYDFLREIIREAGADKNDDQLTLYDKLAPYRIPVVRQALTQLKSRAAQDHAPFIVVLLPSVADGNLSQRRFAGIRELLASLDIPAIDVLDTFDAIDLDPFRVKVFDVHPNIKGHAMIFENLYARLRARPDIWAAVVGSTPLNAAAIATDKAF